jgi:hypothetical protein
LLLFFGALGVGEIEIECLEGDGGIMFSVLGVFGVI